MTKELDILVDEIFDHLERVLTHSYVLGQEDGIFDHLKHILTRSYALGHKDGIKEAELNWWKYQDGDSLEPFKGEDNVEE